MPDIIDYRYMHLSAPHLCVTNGLARDALASFLRAHGSASDFLQPKWFDAIRRFKDHPAVLHFLCEQICISTIVKHGLRLSNTHFPIAKQQFFEGESTAILQEDANTLYIPIMPSSQSISTIFVQQDKGAKTAYVVPIQVAVNHQEFDAETGFYTKWNEWVGGLLGKGYEIRTTFVRILREKREANSFAGFPPDFNIDSPMTDLIPSPKRVEIAFSEVDKRLGEFLNYALVTHVR
jgi:hypothetical protein